MHGRSCRNQTHASGVGGRCAVITPNSQTGTAPAIRTPSHRVTAGVLIAIEHRQHGPDVSIAPDGLMRTVSSPEGSGWQRLSVSSRAVRLQRPESSPEAPHRIGTPRRFRPVFSGLKDRDASHCTIGALVRTPGAAPGTSGWKPDALLLRHARAEGRRHDHHTVAGAASLAGSAGASPVDLP